MWRLRLIIAWTYLTQTYQHCISFLSYIRAYWSTNQYKWAFLSHDMIPISLQYITNEIQPIWMYDSITNRLTSNELERSNHTIDWLSTQLRIIMDHQITHYDIDEFMSTFFISTESVIPSVSILYRCWCIYYKKWFPSTATITFHVIDHNGDEQSVRMDELCSIRYYKN